MKKLFILFFPIFFFQICFADSLSKIEDILKKSKSIKAEFIQISEIEGFGESKYRGILFISKPDKVKINYTSPEENIIFVERNKVIIYNPKDKQAAISNLSDQFIVVKIFNLIAKNQNFTDVFKINKVEEKNNKIIVYLLPKENQQLKLLEITFSKKNYKIKEIKIVDTENNKITLIFKNFEYLKENMPIDFNLPKDTEIFNQ